MYVYTVHTVLLLYHDIEKNVCKKDSKNKDICMYLYIYIMIYMYIYIYIYIYIHGKQNSRKTKKKSNCDTP